MKVSALLLLPILLSSCGLLQMPARLINQVIAPLTEAEMPEATEPIQGIAVRITTPASPKAAQRGQEFTAPTVIPGN